MRNMVSHLAANSSSPTVSFWGAARTVAGSMHLVQFGERKLLLDCGAYGSRPGHAARRPPALALRVCVPFWFAGGISRRGAKKNAPIAAKTTAGVRRARA